MAKRESRNSSTSSSTNDRDEPGKQREGMAALLKQASELGPQVLSLQQALLEGVALAQQREARRLSKTSAPDDPRIAAALDRAQRFAGLGQQVELGATAGKQFIAGLQEDGRFQGYVTHADGSAAVGYNVQLKLRNPQQKETDAAARTDATGYFRIDLPWENRDRGGVTVGRLADRLAQLAAVPAPAPQANPAQASTDGVASSVQVIDPNGRLAYEDPVPPTFDDGASEFRYYMLPEGGRGRGASQGTQETQAR